jgi:membrane carboxypeptidase/penicillin-binding protein PbpC
MTRRGRRWAAVLAAGVLGILAIPRPPLLEGVPFSAVVLDREGRLLRMTLTADEKYRVRTPLAGFAPALADATLRH